MKSCTVLEYHHIISHLYASIVGYPTMREPRRSQWWFDAFLREHGAEYGASEIPKVDDVGSENVKPGCTVYQRWGYSQNSDNMILNMI